MSDFKSIEKQAKRVKELSKKIKEKDISLEEVNELSTLLNEMSDKVAVFKYFLAKNNFDSKGVALPKEEPVAKAPEPVEEPIAISVEETPEPIEEDAEEPQKEEEAQPAFSFSLFGGEEATEPEKVEEEPIEEEAPVEANEEISIDSLTPKEEETAKTEDISEEEIASNLEQAIKDRQSGGSLNDNYLGSDDHSLASKLKNTPIENLKSAIGINIKFTFINELFAGNSDDFNQSVEAIDMMTSADDARNLLSELSGKHNWDLESKPVTQFVEMVERRFM